MKTYLKEVKPTMTDYHSNLESIEKYRREARQVEAEKRKADKVSGLLSQVPIRFRDKTFSDYAASSESQLDVKRIVETYANTFKDRLAEGSSLILMGLPGTGKTYLSFILYQELIKQGYVVEYQSSLNFLRLLQEKQYESFYSLENHLKYYKELPLLIIDEATEGCGKSAHPADWERHLLRMLIDVRYLANRCTVIITNRSKQELIDRLGRPTIDRLAEKGISLAFNWDSYRK